MNNGQWERYCKVKMEEEIWWEGVENEKVKEFFVEAAFF